MSEELLNEIKELKNKVDSLSKNRRVEFEVQMTESNIQIVGGPSTVRKTGTIIGASVLPVSATAITMVLSIVCDDGSFASMDARMCRIID